MTFKIVFDTSSLVGAALRPKSIPAQALQLALDDHEVCVSIESLDETVRILRQEKFDKYVDLTVRYEFLRKLRRDCSLQSVPEDVSIAVQGSCRDSNDDFILALALASQADVIVSSDHDLLVLHPWRDIAVVTPAQFLARFVP